MVGPERRRWGHCRAMGGAGGATGHGGPVVGPERRRWGHCRAMGGAGGRWGVTGGGRVSVLADTGAHRPGWGIKIVRRSSVHRLILLVSCASRLMSSNAVGMDGG